jgi:hypothetical protein
MKATHCLWIVGVLTTLGLTFAAEVAPAQPATNATTTATVPPGAWQPLFDGTALGKWKLSPFSPNGKIKVKNGEIRIGAGQPMSGITWTGEPPARMNYEIELEAMRTAGNDFFCGLTFPVGKDPCSLICGGWGWAVVGLSSIDGYDASENSTGTMKKFEDKKWYKIKVRVTKKQIEAWIDDEKIVTQELEGHSIGIRLEIEPAVPLGISTWYTGSAVRNIRWRNLE